MNERRKSPSAIKALFIFCVLFFIAVLVEKSHSYYDEDILAISILSIALFLILARMAVLTYKNKKRIKHDF